MDDSLPHIQCPRRSCPMQFSALCLGSTQPGNDRPRLGLHTSTKRIHKTVACNPICRRISYSHRLLQEETRARRGEKENDELWTTCRPLGWFGSDKDAVGG